jgi:glycosyltransferase involved in cell wall biosynthesis
MNPEQPDPRHRVAERTRRRPVTVVVPAFNSADTISRTLDSLLAQTFTDFCVLVVDDGSSEPVLDTLPDDPRFLGYRWESNQGYAAVTNRALDMVRSRWVIFVDSDDALDPECLEILVARGESEGSDVVVVALKTIDENGAQGRAPFPHQTSPLPALRALQLFIDGRVLFNQHLLFKPNEVRAKNNTYSDMSFVLALLGSVEKVSFVDRPLYHYYIHSGSATASLRPTVWDLATVIDDVEPAVFATFRGPDARAAIHRLRWMQLQYMVSKAGSDANDPALRTQVYSWCRREIRISHVVDAVRTRHLAKALSLALARLSPALHRQLYLARDRIRGAKYSRAEEIRS